jgi:cobalt-zinc-cadmium efflux system outer membrane protein
MVAEYSANYLSLNALKEKEAIFQLILSQFEDVIDLSTIKLSLGVNSESDLVRLQTEFLALQSLLAGIKNEIFQIESNLKTMLSLPAQTKLETQKINYVFPEKINIQLLIDSARMNRPDFLMAEKNLVLNDMKYKGQKKEAYPMINLGYQPLDGGSNYVRPYSGMVFEMSLPIFNRNQGNIRAAKVGIEQGKYTFEYAQVELENQVAASYLQHLNSKGIYMQYTDQMLQRMNELSVNAKMNFEKRNISLIEYIDHQRAYIDHQMNWIDATSNYYQSINQIYFTVGKEISF